MQYCNVKLSNSDVLRTGHCLGVEVAASLDGAITTGAS